ncbi:MAG TPA: hypothetical protein VGE74_03660 [Gemmata sp.]
MARVYDEAGDDEGDEYDAEFDYDPEDPDSYPEGVYADTERALIPCPHCTSEIDEESEQCPRCGVFLSREDTSGQGKSPLVLVLLLLALLAAVMMARGC